jgi:hypothetical protein
MNIRGTVYYIMGEEIDKIKIFGHNNEYSYNKKISFKSDYNYKMLSLADVQILPDEYSYYINGQKFFIFVPEDLEFDELDLIKKNSYHSEFVSDWRSNYFTPTWVYKGFTKHGPVLLNKSDGPALSIFEIPEEAAHMVMSKLANYASFYYLSYKLAVGVRWISSEAEYTWNRSKTYEENEFEIENLYIRPLTRYKDLIYTQIRNVDKLIKVYRQIPELKLMEEIINDTINK